MSDPRIQMGARPMGGAPAGGAPKGNAGQAATAIRQNRSVFNPGDVAAMGQTGDLAANMTIAQFFQKFGIDVNKDPITKLQQFAQDQMQKADPMNKMSAIAGQSGQPGGSPAPAGPGAPTPGLNDLMGSMGE